MVREKTLLSYFKIHASAAESLNFYTFLVVREEKAREKIINFKNNILIILFNRGMISRTKVQMFSYDQLFQAYQKDKFVLVSELLISFQL